LKAAASPAQRLRTGLIAEFASGFTATATSLDVLFMAAATSAIAVGILAVASPDLTIVVVSIAAVIGSSGAVMLRVLVV
jgi:hypothetical protein